MVATRRSARRTKSSIELRDIFANRPVSPTETTDTDSSSSISRNSSNSSNNSNNDSNLDSEQDFSSTAFLVSLQETIRCRKKMGTSPIFDFIVSGNKVLDDGWLRTELMKKTPLKVADDEMRLMLFIFMSLSGAGGGNKGYSPPVELLSTAWGVSKPAVRRACGLGLEHDFLHWITSCDLIDEDDLNGNKKRPAGPFPNQPTTNTNADDVVFSPALVNRDPKRRDLRPTPLVTAEDLASPASTVSPARERSPISPLLEDGFCSPENSVRSQNDPRRHNRTRLDFNLADNKEVSTQTDDLLPGQNMSPQAELAGRIRSEIQAQKDISSVCEEEVCRALYALFRKKRESLIQCSADDDDLPQISKASLAASAEIITLKPFRNGSPLKIMRIKETRQSKGEKRGRKRRGKGHLVEALLSNLGLSTEETVVVLRSMAARRGLRVMNQNDAGLSIAQCAALMLYLPVTARGLERLQRFVKWALPNSIGPTFMPQLLRKSIAKYSMDSFDLKLGFELVSLEIGGKTRNQRCLHVWIKQPAVAIQRLVQSAMIAGKFEESISFCNHRDELVVVQGSDRGGDITANLVRIANRFAGNSSQHCLPLSFYEFGKESYHNMQQTIFHPNKPTREFLQLLLNKAFQMIVISIHDKSDAIVDAQCVLIRFEFPESSFGGRRLSFVRYAEDKSASSIGETNSEDERALPQLVRLLDPREEVELQEFLRRDVHRLSIQMIVSTSTPEDEEAYSGFILRNCFGRVVCTEFFAENLIANAADYESVKFRCLQVRGITSDDIKCNATLMGQGTAAVMCPCTICIARKKEFASILTKPQSELPSNREGDFANPRLYAGFVAEAKGRADWVRANSTGQARVLKLKYCSVIYEPLLFTPPSLNSCSGMHVSSGLLTHCTIKMLESLGEIDKLTPWLKDLTTELEIAKEFIDQARSSTEQLRKQDTRLARDVQSAKTMRSIDIIQQLEESRNQISLTLMAQTKARDAAKLFVEKGKEFLDGVARKNTTRIMGPATYCFRKAYEVDGRVAFRVENSGFELSNADGIRVLERTDKIAERMKRVFNNNLRLQQAVDTLVEKFLAMARLLYRMAVMMKSQRKWSSQCCEEFHSAAQEYAMLWLAFTGEDDSKDATVFNKLHVLVTHVPQFIRTHGMLGRCSEEGFESSHKCIESVRKPLVCMTSTEDRAHTIYRRIMLQSRPEIESTFESINSRFHQGKRGPYRNKDPTKMKTADSAPAAKPFGGISSLPDGFIESINGYVIKERWKDYFEYVCFSKVPSSWTTVFSEDSLLGEACRSKAEYI
ncbi:unknown protein [Seminavis robusta]|uniref:Uncharacterized protein n=1 Tax=Seminavis robusta TaxID=568900 RepID=A0A9N8HL42_9STRA|nr:unknown protein [Seminavis robusta]|eukprot:Sro780_g201450.1 n/a (1297) ;mRNA; f:13600-17490